MANTAEVVQPSLGAGPEKRLNIIPRRDELEPENVSIADARPNSDNSDYASELKSRLDGMATWAGQVNSDIRGLTAAHQVFQNTVQALATRIDVLADQVVSPVPQSSAGVDPVIGYQPTPAQQAELFTALAEWQLTARQLEKGSVANIQTRGGSTVSYRYADIAAVSEIARSAGTAGLAHFHCEVSRGNQPFIRTYLTHKGGGWISCDVPLLMRENSMTSNLQQWASTCTMARRYGLFMVLGIAAGDEDDDGAQGAAGARSATTAKPRAAFGSRSTSLTPNQ